MRGKGLDVSISSCAFCDRILRRYDRAPLSPCFVHSTPKAPPFPPTTFRGTNCRGPPVEIAVLSFSDKAKYPHGLTQGRFTRKLAPPTPSHARTRARTRSRQTHAHARAPNTLESHAREPSEKAVQTTPKANDTTAKDVAEQNRLEQDRGRAQGRRREQVLRRVRGEEIPQAEGSLVQGGARCQPARHLVLGESVLLRAHSAPHLWRSSSKPFPFVASLI